MAKHLYKNIKAHAGSKNGINHIFFKQNLMDLSAAHYGFNCKGYDFQIIVFSSHLVFF